MKNIVSDNTRIFLAFLVDAMEEKTSEKEIAKN